MDPSAFREHTVGAGWFGRRANTGPLCCIVAAGLGVDAQAGFGSLAS